MYKIIIYISNSICNSKENLLLFTITLIIKEAHAIQILIADNFGPRKLIILDSKNSTDSKVNLNSYLLSISFFVLTYL